MSRICVDILNILIMLRNGIDIIKLNAYNSLSKYINYDFLINIVQLVKACNRHKASMTKGLANC